MAQTIIGETPDTKPQQPKIFPEAYKHSIVQSSLVPHTSLLSFINGSPTMTEYYRGMYAEDEEQQGFEPDSIETYSSYTRINNLIIKLDDGEGTFNFDDTKAVSEKMFTGYVLFDLAPGKGDLFIRDIGDGRAGLFSIFTQPQPRTIHADKCYYIEARFQAIVTEAIMNNLNTKVVNELYYQKDVQVAGGNPLLSKSDRNFNLDIQQLQLAIMDEILAKNYFSDEETIIIPNDSDDILYDPYLAKFLSYTLPTNLLGMRKQIRILDVNYWADDRQQQEPITVWDMFYRNGFRRPEHYQNEYWVHPRANLMNTRMYGNVYYSKMDRAIVVHEDPAVRQAYMFKGGLFPVGPVAPIPEGPGQKYDYFFSKEFYTGEPKDEIEAFVFKMFRDKTVDKEQMVKVLENFWKLTPVQKLYMGGIYVGACKTALLNNSTFT
jgi:hypothetical protein